MTFDSTVHMLLFMIIIILFIIIPEVFIPVHNKYSFVVHKNINFFWWCYNYACN